MAERASLEDEVSMAFERACREHDWEIAEFLFQALEAIARREGQDARLQAALDRWVEVLASPSQ